MHVLLFFFVDQAADNERFAVSHPHIGVRHAAGNFVIAQFADQSGRTYFRMHDCGNHLPVAAHGRGIGKSDAGIEIFRGGIGAGTVMFFRLYRNMVANKNTCFSSGNGNDARSRQQFGLAAGKQRIQGSAEIKGIAAPEFKFSLIGIVFRV